MTEVIYLLQIILLFACLYMTWSARHALNGLGRGLMLLFILLIVRRLDDAFSILSADETLILSSAVVLVVTWDIYQIYKAREVYALYLRNRQARIDVLESMFRNESGR